VAYQSSEKPIAMKSRPEHRPQPTMAAAQLHRPHAAAGADGQAVSNPLLHLRKLADSSPQAAQLMDRSRMLAANIAQRMPGRMPASMASGHSSATSGSEVVQRAVYANDGAMWAAVAPATPYVNIMAVINGNAELSNLYQAVIGHLAMMNFVVVANQQPDASYAQNAGGTYDINYDIPANQAGDFQLEEFFVGAIIHEMAHVASSQLYQTQVPEGDVHHIANMHLPALAGPVHPNEVHVGTNQLQDPVAGADVQQAVMIANWTILDGIVTTSNDLSPQESQHLQNRVGYAVINNPDAHYDTVLLDILFYLQHRHMTETQVYLQATAMLHEANIRRAAGVGTVQNVAAVGAPAQDTHSVHQCVQQLLNDARWSGKGEAFIGHKTPAGIRRLRGVFQSQANERDALVAVRDAAAAIAIAASPHRALVTQQAYDALSDDHRTAGVNATILAVNAVIALL
jgi:hypothetical protein